MGDDMAEAATWGDDMAEAATWAERFRSDCRPDRLGAVAPRLLPDSRSSRFIRVQVDAIRPFRDEAIVLMADQNFRGVTADPIVFRQLYGGTKRLCFAWESCSDTAMRVFDFPSAIVVDHDISRFMQLFLQPLFIHVRREKFIRR
jgi:hypothetical protein